MESQQAHALVVQALTCRLSNVVEWINDKQANQVRSNPANRDLGPEEIKTLVRDHVRAHGSKSVEQRPETRPQWVGKREYWYRVIIPLEDFPTGLFVELELLDDDPEVPVVALLNAHPHTT